MKYNINIYFPACGGLYHYWFGVAQAMQNMLSYEDIHKLKFHSISGSGFPVSTLLMGYNVKSVYQLWGNRFEKVVYSGGWFHFYDLLELHCYSIIPSCEDGNDDFNNIFSNHSIYCVKFPSFKLIKIQIKNKDNYIKSLISSALIPFLTPKLFCIMDGKILIDGGIRTFIGLSSEFKRVRSIIKKEATDESTPTIYHLEKILNYKSVRFPLFWRAFGLFCGKREDLFSAGYTDMINALPEILPESKFHGNGPRRILTNDMTKDINLTNKYLLFGSLILSSFLIHKIICYNKIDIKIMKRSFNNAFICSRISI
tara:strand:- start:743 stop:1678 length:936 start_codon:yes stop_codon:yes gene_type:complete